MSVSKIAGAALRALFSLIVALVVLSPGLAQEEEDARGVVVNKPEAFDGYTFIAPHFNNIAYVIDNDGRVINEWNIGDFKREIHLLDNGNVLVVRGSPEELDKSLIPLAYEVDGAIVEFTWDGDKVWEYVFRHPHKRHHHGIDVLPNGNILALVWEYHHIDEALALGLDPAVVEATLAGYDHFLPDSIVEIDRANSEIVWEWRAWDHLIQDLDEKLPNYGAPAANPQRIDINYEQYLLKSIPTDWSAGPADWMHSNMVNYNPILDQIVISVLRFDEFWIINHGAAAEEADGRASDLLYRWGNPFAYGAGDMVEDRKLFQQHDAQWIEEGLPGAGNILIYNNRNNLVREHELADDEYSSILEIKLPLREDGSYDWSADAEIVWRYDTGFYSRIISGVQRLPNGNTLITAGVPGRVLEVTPDGEVVWEFLNPVPPDARQWLFRVRKYPADHPGLAGKDLTPGRVLAE